MMIHHFFCLISLGYSVWIWVEVNLSEPGQRPLAWPIACRCCATAGGLSHSSPASHCSARCGRKKSQFMAISVGTHGKTDDKIDKWVVAQAKHPFNSQGFLRFLVQVSLATTWKLAGLSQQEGHPNPSDGAGDFTQVADDHYKDQIKTSRAPGSQRRGKTCTPADAPLPRCFPFSFDVNIVYSGSRPKVLSAGNLRCLLVVVEVTFGFKHRQNTKRCLNDAELPC